MNARKKYFTHATIKEFAHDTIKRYISRGWKIIRLRANSKVPADVGWTTREGLSEEEAIE